MHGSAIIMLAAVTGLLAWQTMRDRRGYSVFKTLEDTHARRRCLRGWTLASIAMFAGGGLAILAVLGRLDTLTGLPAEFAGLMPASEPAPDTGSADYVVGMVVGFALGAALLFFIWRQRLRKMRAPVIGDIEPMLPRERGEYPYTAALGIAAGVTEEVFFRAALPLLAYEATGSAMAAFVIAGLLFGMMHWYQGMKGVLAVTIMGGVFTLLYLSSGSLLKPMLVHVVMDLVALVIRPAISTRMQARAIAANT